MISEHIVEVLDGLLLGAAHFLDRPAPELQLVASAAYMAWVKQVADVLSRSCLVRVTVSGKRVELRATGDALAGTARRWTSQRVPVPRDVRLTPTALAHWFAGAGARASNSYSARLHSRAGLSDLEFLAERLRELYHWDPVIAWDVSTPFLRLSRSGDRVGLRRLVVGLLPACFARRLAFRESKPCSPEEAARRRKPRRLTPELVAEARRRIAAGDAYGAIALDCGVNTRAIGKLARGETHRDPGVVVVRKRAKPRRFTADEERDVFARLAKGESQGAVARALGCRQSRIWWLLKKKRTHTV